MPAHSNGAAASNGIDSGTRSTKPSSTTISLEYPPCVTDPSRSIEP